MGNYFMEGHVLFESIKKLNLKSPTIAGIAIPAMPYDSPAMEVHNYGSYSHYHYKRYEVFLEIISNNNFLINAPFGIKKGAYCFFLDRLSTSITIAFNYLMPEKPKQTTTINNTH